MIMINRACKTILFLGAVCALSIPSGSSFVTGDDDQSMERPMSMSSIEIESIQIGAYGRLLCDVIRSDILLLKSEEVLVEQYGIENQQSRVRMEGDPDLWNAIRSLETSGLTRDHLIADGSVACFTILLESGQYRIVTIHEASTVNNLPDIIKKYSRQ